MKESLSPSVQPPSFADIFRREVGYVCGALRRLGVQERDLEDVAQEVFVQVHRKLATYDPTRPLRPWLAGFAFRCASDYRRRPMRRHVPVEEVGDVAMDVAPPSSADAALVTEALAALEPERRAILVAFEVEDMPMKTIAEDLGIPLFTAYSRVRLAREDFERAVARCRARRST